MFCLRRLIFILTVSSFLSASLCCAQEGLWDASIDSPGGPIRFGLKLDVADPSGQWTGYLINGTEKIEIPQVQSKTKGSVVLDIAHYDSRLILELVPGSDGSESKLVGTWKKRRTADNWVEMKCEAVPAKPAETASKDVAKFDGRWLVSFESSAEPSVGVFKSDPNTGTITGTFLTTTGDYRFLVGSVVDGQLELSCFDGAHAFLFKATLQADDSLKGDFWSSNTWHETWTATRDKDAKIADGFELTSATESNINALSFPDLDQQQTRLDDDRFAAPVRIVHIFGSWCPNCHDAGEYLAQLEKKYGEKISVVGVAFELTGDFERDVEQVRKYLTRHKLNHPVLVGGGSSSKDKATEAIKIIDKVRSFPTTIFADSSGKIIAVHQGFSGPATGDDYVQLKKKFESTIDGILDSNKSEN